MSYWKSFDKKEYRGTLYMDAENIWEALEMALADKRCPSMDYLTEAEAIVCLADHLDGDYCVSFSVSNVRRASEVEPMV